jgi:hypothetical protein
MKRAMTIVGMLLLVCAVSCRKENTAETPVKAKVIPDTAPAETKPVDPLDEVQTLIEAARKVSSSDSKTALSAWDKAAACLHDCMYTSNQVYWLQMNSEIEKAREKLINAQTLKKH